MLRSHFRIGASMAIPAMAAGVGAAAIWRQRTGEGQDLTVDLRQAVWNTNPLISLVHDQLQAAGVIPASDPIPASLTTWVPSVNGVMLQAPVGLGNPLSFQAFETRDGRFINLTGIYPHLLDRILNVLKVPPEQAAIRAAVKKWDGQELEDTLAANNGVAALHREGRVVVFAVGREQGAELQLVALLPSLLIALHELFDIHLLASSVSCYRPPPATAV